MKISVDPPSPTTPSRSTLFGGYWVPLISSIFKATLVRQRANRKTKPVENYYIILIIYIWILKAQGSILEQQIDAAPMPFPGGSPQTRLRVESTQPRIDCVAKPARGWGQLRFSSTLAYNCVTGELNLTPGCLDDGGGGGHFAYKLNKLV